MVQIHKPNKIIMFGDAVRCTIVLLSISLKFMANGNGKKTKNKGKMNHYQISLTKHFNWANA